MSSNPAESSSPAVHAQSSGAKAWSITARLVLFYTVSTALLLSLAMGILYWAVVRHIDNEDKDFLTDKLHALRADLREHPDEQPPLNDEVKAGAAGGPVSYYIRVTDRDGRVLNETSGMEKLLPSTLFPIPAALDTNPGGVEFKTPGGKWFLIVSARANVGIADRETYVVQIAQDRSDDKAFLFAFRGLLAVVLTGGIVASAATAVAVTGQGLRPLTQMAKSVERVSATQLHERISPANCPKELVSLATAFDQMLGRLEDSFARLSRFSADLAHELRTPIYNLRGEAEVALSKARSAEEYRSVIESSLEEFNRISRMSESLLFLARAESHETRIECCPVDARAEAESIIEFCEAEAEERGVEMGCVGGALVQAESILFRRALTNLLSNALQHTRKGGKVTVSINALDGQGVEVSVADTGRGIAREHLPKVFDRFYRADASRHQSQGAGLGLAIVKSIMELHGGSVAIESELGKGTTLTLTFPRSTIDQPS